MCYNVRGRGGGVIRRMVRGNTALGQRVREPLPTDSRSAQCARRLCAGVAVGQGEWSGQYEKISQKDDCGSNCLLVYSKRTIDNNR